MSARAEPRFTRDINVAVMVDDDADSERTTRPRPQDLADLRALLAAATPDDLATARDSARLISARGYDRGRDLIAALTEL